MCPGFWKLEIFFLIAYLFIYFAKGSLCVDQISVRLAVFLPQPLECWDF